MRLLIVVLAVATAAAGAWCNCAGSATGNFGAVLSLASTANVTVLIGETVSSPHAEVFSSGSNPQALVMHLASTFAGGQAVAASQLQTRCVRYTRGGFQLMATTALVIASRNRSTLTWLHVELDLFAACSSTRDINVFRVARSAIRVMPVDLMELETKSDQLGPLVDASETICRPRASPWFGVQVQPELINSAQTMWRVWRTFAVASLCAQICGPAVDDPVDGHYFARNPTRKYVQVCAYDDAVLCASDAMMISTLVTSDEGLQEFTATPSLGFTRVNHWTTLFDDGDSFTINRYVVDVNVNRHNRQMSSLLTLSQSATRIARRRVVYIDEPEDVSPLPSDVVNWTVPRLLHYINLTNNAIALLSVGGSGLSGAENPLSTDCLLNTTLHTHFCDPLVMADRYVHFGDQLTDTFFATGTAIPCAPAVTAVCPPVKLPPPVFSGATTAGIVHGVAAGVLIVGMLAATVSEWRSRSSPPPAVVAKPQPELPPELPAKPVEREKPAQQTMTLQRFWNKTRLTFHTQGKKSM